MMLWHLRENAFAIVDRLSRRGRAETLQRGRVHLVRLADNRFVVDESFELNGKDKPTLTRHFTAGVHHVAVRVTDDKGARAYANATIKVAKAPKKKK